MKGDGLVPCVLKAIPAAPAFIGVVDLRVKGPKDAREPFDNGPSRAAKPNLHGFAERYSSSRDRYDVWVLLMGFAEPA